MRVYFYDWLAGEPWLASWWRAMPSLWRGQLVAAAVFSAAAAFLGWRSRRRIPWGMGAALVPIGASMAYWFWMAPDPRFSGNAATVALAGATAFLAAELSWARSGIVLALLIAVAIGLPLVRTDRARLMAERGFWRNAPTALPAVKFEDRFTESGLKIAVPADGAQSSWGQRLPASYKFDPTLALRDPADMRRGFYVTDPTFQPIGWGWPQFVAATIDRHTYGAVVHGGGGVDKISRYMWFEPPVRMIVYSLEPRVVRLRFEVAHIKAPSSASVLITVFAKRRKVGEFALVVGTVVDLRFTLDRGFNEILFVQNWGERGYRFAAVKTPAGTVFGNANYRFTAVEQPSPR